MNIVFDVGNVLLEWRPAELLQRYLPDESQRQAVRRELIEHPDWVELDRGTLSYPEAIARVAARSGAVPATIGEILHHVHEALHPIPGTVDLLLRVRQAGHSAYVLSNMHAVPADALELTHAFFAHFAAVVFSCRVRLAKPDPRIYRHLLERCSLDPAHTVFIDDLDINVGAAREQGIHGIRFHHPGQLAHDLGQLGCL